MRRRQDAVKHGGAFGFFPRPCPRGRSHEGRREMKAKKAKTEKKTKKATKRLNAAKKLAANKTLKYA